MNRHRANWSAMHDMNTEQSQTSKDFDEFRDQVRLFSAKYSFNEAVSIIRRIYEEDND